jgi:DNA replication protein DnaC
MQRSGIKRIKRLEDFDWAFNPKIPKDKIYPFFKSADWVDKAANLVFIGPAGVGKSHLADALCYQMISNYSIPATRITCFDLVEKLKKSTHKYNLLNYYATVKILCLDELGYVFPSQDQANDLFQIISKRSELLPTIVTTNLIPSQWGKIFEAATATAILDRLSLNGNFITCEGRSYRSKK